MREIATPHGPARVELHEAGVAARHARARPRRRRRDRRARPRRRARRGARARTSRSRSWSSPTASRAASRRRRRAQLDVGLARGARGARAGGAPLFVGGRSVGRAGGVPDGRGRGRRGRALPRLPRPPARASRRRRGCASSTPSTVAGARRPGRARPVRDAAGGARGARSSSIPGTHSLRSTGRIAEAVTGWLQPRRRRPRRLSRTMHYKRVIPCMDVDGGRVVKGTRFIDIRDAGDPVELAAHYDREGADELIFLDITATSDKRSTVVELARRAADEVFVPFTIGGGVREVADAQAVLDAGADKVSINSAAVGRPGADRRARGRLRRAVRGAGDRRQAARRRHVGGLRRRRPHARPGSDALAWAREGVERGAGEILLTSMDRDGTKDGYDLSLTMAVSGAVDVPVIASGGVGTPQHMVEGAARRARTPSSPPRSSTTASTRWPRSRTRSPARASPSGDDRRAAGRRSRRRRRRSSPRRASAPRSAARSGSSATTSARSATRATRSASSSSSRRELEGSADDAPHGRRACSPTRRGRPPRSRPRPGGAACIVIPAETRPRPRRPEGNALLGALFGVELRYVGAVGWAAAEAASAGDRRRSSRRRARAARSCPPGCSSPRGALGFVAAHDELQAPAAGEAGSSAAAAIVHASSSCGTAAGLAARPGARTAARRS